MPDLPGAVPHEGAAAIAGDDTMAQLPAQVGSVWSKSEELEDDASEENELATIRVRTMFGLVEEPIVRDEQVRALYLTNMQAKLFDSTTVPKMLAAFEIDDSSCSLVINLLVASFFPCDFAGWSGLSEDEIETIAAEMGQNVQGSSDSFRTSKDASEACRRLTAFFKTVLLPLAAETNAIILTTGMSDDIMALTLASVLPLFEAQHGGQLPFTVIAISTALKCTYCTMYDPASYACELANKSKNWRKAFSKFTPKLVNANWNQDDYNKWGRYDIVPGLRNYIMLESISGKTPDRHRLDLVPLSHLTNVLLQELSSNLPTVCVWAGGSGRSTPLTQTVQLSNRDIPVLMIDPEDRSDDLSKVREQLSGVETANPDEDPRDTLVREAIALDTYRHRALWAIGKIQQYDQHYLAFFFDVLNCDGDPTTTVDLHRMSAESEEQTLYESLRDAEDAAGVVARPFTETQLEMVLKHLIGMMAQSHIRSLPKPDREKLAPGFDPTSPQLEIENFDPGDHWADRLNEIWSVYYDIFQSERVYGANLANLPAVKQLIDQIVKRDRLPPKNSLEAQQALRDAWNAVDIFVHNARKYKQVAKLAYFTQLLLCIVIVVLTVFRERINDSLDCALEDETCSSTFSSSATFVASSLLTLLTGMTEFVQPSQRWRELRAIAESLQSDIFQFRTRTGSFAISLTDPRQPELTFRAKIQQCRTTVIQSGGLTESSFARAYPSHVFQHGQNERASKITFDVEQVSDDGPIDFQHRAVSDNHHSPMKPSQYISARIVPMQHYYRSRVPRKYRERKALVFLVLVATSGIAVLSYLSAVSDPASARDFSAAAGAVSAVSAALTSWGAADGADRKINRYTNASVAMENHLLWWNTLPAVEQNSQINIDRLVRTAEDIKLAEANAWADASRAKEKHAEDEQLSVVVRDS